MYTAASQKCLINYSSYARSLIYSLLGTMFKIHFDIACLLHIVDTGVNHWLLQQNQLLLINKNKYKIVITCSILLVSNFKISMKCRDEGVSLVRMCIFFGTVPFWKENLILLSMHKGTTAYCAEIQNGFSRNSGKG